MRRKPVSLKLGFGGGEYGYAVDLGLPVKTGTSGQIFRPMAIANARRRTCGVSRQDCVSMSVDWYDSLFFRDPEIKAEAAWTEPRLKRSTAFALREGPGARVLSEGGEWRAMPSPLGPADSLMTH